MKKRVVLSLCALTDVLLLMFVFVVPLKSLDTQRPGCNNGKSFHILLGQYSEYYHAVAKDRDGIDPLYDGVCPQNDNHKLKLYL